MCPSVDETIALNLAGQIRLRKFPAVVLPDPGYFVPEGGAVVLLGQGVEVPGPDLGRVPPAATATAAVQIGLKELSQVLPNLPDLVQAYRLKSVIWN